MAVYKVPQDVEAEDKLIGPFSFRQFIYLIVAAITIGIEWVLAQIFILLVLIPMPITLLFLAIALPLRKDQPMELWLAAVLKFFLKPRLKMWWPEGEINLVTIIAPHTKEERLTKDLTAQEAEQRFTQLAEVIDTQGWSARGIHDYNVLQQYGSLKDTTIAEAASAVDIMDETQGVGQQFNSLIEEQEKTHLRTKTNEFRQAMHDSAVRKNSTPTPITTPTRPAPTRHDVSDSVQMNQARQTATEDTAQTPVSPIDSQPAVNTRPVGDTSNDDQTTSTSIPKTDILDLANNNTMSVSSIAREAHRRESKDDEIVIKLR